MKANTRMKNLETKYLYQIDFFKKDETDLSQVLLDIQNHSSDIEPFEYDKTILEKKNFIITPNSIERIRKISYYISRGVPVLLEGPSGTSKTFSTEFSCLAAKTKKLIRFNMSSDTVPSDLLGKVVGDKTSLAGISIKEGDFLRAFKYGHPLLLDEINLASPAVLQCIEEALDSEVISLEMPGFPLIQIPKKTGFSLIATQNPNKGLFANKRQNLGKKFMSKFQVITFPEFTEDELYQIAIGLAKSFGFKGGNAILEDLVKFHKKWASSEKIKDDVQCFTVREIAASVKAFAKGENIYDTILTIYGARYKKDLRMEIETLLKSYPSFKNLQPEELTIPNNFPKCFQNKSLLQAIKSIKFSLDNNRHVIISGNEGSGKTQLALWFAEWYKKEKKIEKEYIFYCLCTEELKCSDLIGRQYPTEKSERSDATGRQCPKEEDNDQVEELLKWENGFLSTAIEKGGIVILDALDQASTTVTERLNGLLDQKYDNTEPAKFYVSENPNNSEIDINKNFRLICTTEFNKINQMSPAFINRFDVIFLEDQMEAISENDKKELVKFLLINSYKENKIKKIIERDEKKEENQTNSIQEFGEKIDERQNAIKNEENSKKNINTNEQYNDDIDGLSAEEGMGVPERTPNISFEDDENSLDENYVDKFEKKEKEDQENSLEDIFKDDDKENKNEGENLDNSFRDNNINNQNKINREGEILIEKNEKPQDSIKNLNENQNEILEEMEEVEESFNPKDDLIDLVLEKSGYFKTIYK